MRLVDGGDETTFARVEDVSASILADDRFFVTDDTIFIG